MKPYFENEHGKLYHGDCLEIMSKPKKVPVDMILVDPPYGTTQCKWDAVIPFSNFWSAIWNSIKENGVVTITAAQPFTSALVMSQAALFKYSWTWDKVNGIRNHLNAKKQPMRCKEDITVFYKKQPTYNPQMRKGGYTSRKTKPGQSEGFGTANGIDKGRKITSLYPIDILKIESHDPNNSLHPTQKPVALFSYLIRTYTNLGETVLDFCAGSGTTAIAAQETGRKWILIEKEEEYCETIAKRLSK